MGIKSRGINNIKITVKNDTPETRNLLGMFARAEQKVNVLRYLEDEGEYNRMVAGDVVQSLVTSLLDDGNFQAYLRESATVLPDFFRRGDFSYDKFIANSCFVVTNQSSMRKMSLVADVIENYITEQVTDDIIDQHYLVESLLRQPQKIDELAALRLEEIRSNAAANFMVLHKYISDNIEVLNKKLSELPDNPDKWTFKDIGDLHKALIEAHWGSDENPVDYKNNPLLLDFMTDCKVALPFDSLTKWMALNTEYRFDHKFEPASKDLIYSLKMSFNNNFRKQEIEKDRKKYYTDFVKDLHRDVLNYRSFLEDEQKKKFNLEKNSDDPNNYPYSRGLLGCFIKINNRAYVDAQNIFRETLADAKISIETLQSGQLLEDETLREAFYGKLLKTIFHEYNHYQLYNRARNGLPPREQSTFMNMLNSAHKCYKNLENSYAVANDAHKKEILEQFPSSYAAKDFQEFYAESFGFWYAAVAQNKQELLESYREKWSPQIFKGLGL